MPPRHVAVLGGGITGLTTAFYLAKALPKTSRITLLEKSHRVGGWIKSFPIENSRVALESGPRTFKATNMAPAVAQLIQDLNLVPYLVAAPLTAPASRNRYLYLNDEQDGVQKKGLTLLPPTPLHMLFNPEFRWILKDLGSEFFKPGNKPSDDAMAVDDESVDAFISRRFSSKLARTLGSAMIHGIYAADSRELSMKATFPIMVHAEKMGKGKVLRGLPAAFKQRAEMGLAQRAMFGLADLREVGKVLNGASAFTLMGGMEMVPRTLQTRLEDERNVEVVLGNGCQSLEKEDGDFKLTLDDGSSMTASHVVSTLALPALHGILAPSKMFQETPLPQLLHNPSTSVQVLNLVFPPSPKALNPPGFGFLVPRPSAGYPTSPTTTSPSGKTILQNLLGTVFDSSVDASHDHRTQPTIMTLMMGGPFPMYSPAGSTKPSTNLPGSDSAVLSPADLQIYLDTLQHYLGPTSEPLPEPTMNALHTHWNCIPTAKPGSPMELRQMLRAVPSPRLVISGGGMAGVGLGDAVTSARMAVLKVLMDDLGGEIRRRSQKQ